MTSPNDPTTLTATADRTRPTTRRKKKKSAAAANNHQSKHTSSSSSQTTLIASSNNWKSQTQHQIYSTKLLRALRHVSTSSSSSSSSGRGSGGAVREAADRALAVTARGRSRWSRAILTNRLKLDYFRRINKKKRKLQSGRSEAVTGNFRSRKTVRVSVYRLKAKSLPAVQRKARVLGRLVPGCRKESLPVILEEAEDYIPALEMQVRVMSRLLSQLNGLAQPPN